VFILFKDFFRNNIMELISLVFSLIALIISSHQSLKAQKLMHQLEYEEKNEDHIQEVFETYISQTAKTIEAFRSVGVSVEMSHGYYEAYLNALLLVSSDIVGKIEAIDNALRSKKYKEADVLLHELVKSMNVSLDHSSQKHQKPHRSRT